MQDILPLLEELNSLASPEGVWGYAPGQSPHIEPTTLGILAYSLEAERFAAERDKAVQALSQSVRADGSVRLEGDREEATWPTSGPIRDGRPERSAGARESHRASGVYVNSPTPHNRKIHDIGMTPWAGPGEQLLLGRQRRGPV